MAQKTDPKFDKDLDTLQTELRTRLSQELTEFGGIPFSEDKDDGLVKPADDKEARLLQSGSAFQKRSPSPFVDQALASFTKRAGIRRG